MTDRIASVGQRILGPRATLTSTGSIADGDALDNITSTPLPNGAQCWVIDRGDATPGLYVLRKDSTDTADGLYIVQPIAGPGRWHFLVNDVTAFAGQWKDQLGSISEGTGAGALTYEGYRDTPFELWFWRYNQDDILSMVFELNHDWNQQGPVRPHLHVKWMADPASPETFVVDGYYSWSAYGQTTPALSGWTSYIVSASVDPGDVYKEYIIGIGDIDPPAWQNLTSAHLLVYMRRPGLSSTDPEDTYHTNKSPGTAQANVGLLHADVHYRVDKPGTFDEFGPS